MSHEADASGVDPKFRRPFFDVQTAAEYVPCKTVNAFYRWRLRHGIKARANGSIAKADLDYALKYRGKKPRNPNAKANLKQYRQHSEVA